MLPGVYVESLLYDVATTDLDVQSNDHLHINLNSLFECIHYTFFREGKAHARESLEVHAHVHHHKCYDQGYLFP